MVLEIHLGKGYALEKAYRRKVGEEPKGWCSQVGREGYGFGVWKSIMKRWGIFKAKTRFEVGHGRRIKCWYEDWMMFERLKDKTLFVRKK